MEYKPDFWDFIGALSRDEDWYDKLIGEEYDKKLLYMYDEKQEVVTVYKSKIRHLKSLWNVGKAILIIALSAILVLVLLPALETIFLWPNISNDVFIIWPFVFFIIYINLQKFTYRYINLELLNKINLGERINNNDKSSVRLSKKVVIILGIIYICFFLLSSYSLTYLRFVADGGYSNNVVEVRGTFGGLEFDDDMLEIPGSLDVASDSVQQICLHIHVDKCPDAVSIYINEQIADLREAEYYRWSEKFFDESYFQNTIHADVEFAAREVNTLEVRAGGYKQAWTFRFS